MFAYLIVNDSTVSYTIDMCRRYLGADRGRERKKEREKEEGGQDDLKTCKLKATAEVCVRKENIGKKRNDFSPWL